VWFAVVAFLALVVALRRTPGLFDRFGGMVSTWMFLAVVQGGIGYVQYFNDVPAVLVAAHVAGATALWVATVWLILAGLEPVVDGASERGEDGVADAISDRVPQSL
jgi:heme A synthase